MKIRVNGSALVLRRRNLTLLTVEELAAAAGVHPDLVEKFVSYGLLEPDAADSDAFSASAVERLRSIMRLREDLGVNLAGIAVILDMRAKMEALKRELEELRKRFERQD